MLSPGGAEAAAGPIGTAPGGHAGAAPGNAPPGNPVTAANAAPAAGEALSHCSNWLARVAAKELQSGACPRAG